MFAVVYYVIVAVGCSVPDRSPGSIHTAPGIIAFYRTYDYDCFLSLSTHLDVACPYSLPGHDLDIILIVILTLILILTPDG